MTDGELFTRMNDALLQINEAVEGMGGILEVEKPPDLRWTGLARLPAGKLLINSRKTGRQAAADSRKAVAEAVVDLTLEGRFLGRVLVYAENTEVELPGGGRRPLDHSGVARIFNSL